MISEKAFQEWGGETLIIKHHKRTGAYILIAIHSTGRGPAAGSVRMRPYDNLQEAIEDVLKLSSAMTYKFATANMNWGGGKSVIVLPEDLEIKSRQALLQDYGKLLKTLNGEYYVGPDVGTTSEDMDLIYQTGGICLFTY